MDVLMDPRWSVLAGAAAAWCMESAAAYWVWLHASLVPLTGELFAGDLRTTPVALIAATAAFVGTQMIAWYAISAAFRSACSAVWRAWQSSGTGRADNG